MMLLKKLYDKLVVKVNIDKNHFVLKTKYNNDKIDLEKKFLTWLILLKKQNSPELENKIPDISKLATKTALTMTENKIPDVSSLVKKNML